MTNRITSDNFSTHQAIKQRNFDAKSDGSTSTAPTSSHQPSEHSAKVDRAQERLAQEVTSPHDANIGSFADAQKHVAKIEAQFAADPSAGLKALGRVNGNLVEAAISRPTA
ncbi:hypothetical protein [Thiosocius teredinicola]|uniref:hypothetical protein n=1 Tax=Thiosocius teredinicola TaxID=1973002 RepID=UPI00099140B1